MRWPAASWAHCRRPPAATPASGSTPPGWRCRRRYETRLAELEAERDARVLAEERVDVTLPWDRIPRGARHPLTTLIDRIADIFVGMGYEVADGPELEAEWLNSTRSTSAATTRPAR